jgi:hypothetical protein
MALLDRRRIHDLFLVAAFLCAGNATPQSLAAGLVLFVAGMALHMWSKAVLNRNVQLCTDGPYSICRHPFYLSNAMLDFGVCVMSGTWLLVAVYPVAFWVAYAPTVRNEENLLRELYSELHKAYCANTPALLPSLRGLLRSGKSYASWQNLLHERELSRLVRYSSFPLAVMFGARLWHSHWHKVDRMALTLGAAALGLYFLSEVIYHTLEERQVDRALPALVMWLSRNAFAVCSGSLLGLAIAWDAEVQDVLFAAGLVAFQVGCWSFASGAWARGASVAMRLVAVVLGLCWLEATWAIPFVLALHLSEALLGYRERGRWAAPRVRLALASTSCAIGIVVISMTGGFSKSHFLGHVAAVLRQNAQAGDTVIVVADRDLAGLEGRAHVDAIVHENRVRKIKKLLLGKRRAIIVVEANEVPHLDVLLKKAVISPLAEWCLGIEKFSALAVQLSPDDARTG